MSSGMALPILSQPSAPGLEHKAVWSTPRPLEEMPDDQS